MRALRILADDTWYFASTAVNNREPLFWSPLERARFKRVLDEARVRYACELRGLSFSGPWVSFYIKPADGFELPVIMQWGKQTYAVRYNVYDGRTGHIWGDRYESGILPGSRRSGREEGVEGDCGGQRGRAWETRSSAGQSGAGHGGQTPDEAAGG
jgi:hypothetical protein